MSSFLWLRFSAPKGHLLNLRSTHQGLDRVGETEARNRGKAKVLPHYPWNKPHFNSVIAQIPPPRSEVLSLMHSDILFCGLLYSKVTGGFRILAL